VPEWMPSQFKGAKAYDRSRTSSRLSVESYSVGEVVANAISTGVGAALAIAGIAILVVIAVLHGGGLRLLGALTFSIPLFLAFLMSTLYHAIPAEGAKRVFEVLDCIFVLAAIAGVLTPYCLIAAGDSIGPVICGIEWIIAVAGIVVELVWFSRPRWLPIAISGAMVLVAVPLFPALFAVMPSVGWWLGVAGALCFVARLVLALLNKVPYLSFVSHVMAVAGCVLLFFSVALFVL